MVFRKRGQTFQHEQWTYKGQAIDIVDAFNYLGTVFNYTGSFSGNIEYLTGKALKAMNTLLLNCNKVPISPKMLCQLFDSFVGTILSYSSEL